MIREKKKGMWLENGVYSKKDRSGWMIHTILAVLTYCMFTFVLIELTGLDKLFNPRNMLIAGSVICLVYGISLRFQKQGWIYPAVLLLLLVSVLVFREEILEGGRLVWNHISNRWTAKTGWLLPELKMQMEQQQWDRCLLLFAVVGSIPGALLCCMLTTRKWPAAAVLVSGLTLAGMTVFRMDMTDLTAFCLPMILMISVFLLISSGWERKKMPGLTFGIWIFLALAGVILTSGNILQKTEDWASDISSSFQQDVHEHRFETVNTVLPEGDFTGEQIWNSDFVKATDTKKDTITDGTQEEDQDAQKKSGLIVTMEQPETLYLRGFTGTLFEENRWTELDKQVLAEQEDLLYWLNLNEFDVRTQLKGAMPEEEADLNFVTVQNAGACSRYYYVPYNLASAEFLTAENLDPDMVLADGERSYGFSMIAGSSERIGALLELLQKSEEEDVLKYRQAESAYREFVYNNYMQIPAEAEELLTEQWNRIAAEYGNQEELTKEQAQACVRSFLEQCFSEEETASAITLPLQMAAGSSYQYATTAVLTLRHFGFPARYAEGYVITEEMIADTEPGTPVEADSSCAGAWAEVYQDGIGWIPLELTAGIKGISAEQTDGDQNGDADSTENEPANEEMQETEQEETESELPEEKDDEMEIQLPDLLNWRTLLAVCILLLLVLLFLIIRRHILISRKKEKFLQEEAKEAVAFIVADAVRLLEELGYDRGNGSLYALCDSMGKHFSEPEIEMFREVIGLNAQAVFSSRPMTEEQRDTVLDFYYTVLASLKWETKWLRRLHLKWIQCLW
ncbi:transglutaminase domain-containing protein [Ruminococcus sp. 5_1_39BFAA]|uniref:transglutaminase domain-containing protein n=1 Tax=Ruminococcus sp. 5_1_39BFAA TaxID=457412 RepID=UPI00356299EC